VQGPLKLALGEAMLELERPPSVEDLKQQASSPSATLYERRHAEELLREMEKTGRVGNTYPYLVHVARFGDDLMMVGLAGEVVVDYSLRLKKELAGPAVWVAGYTNEVSGYVPSRRVLEEGGYEARGAIVYYSTIPLPFTPAVESRIVDKVHELVRQARSGR
jgi:neutral ceramidase